MSTSRRMRRLHPSPVRRSITTRRWTEMGSIGTYREKGQTDLAFFQDFYPSFKFHALTRVSGVVYAACSKPEGADPDEVFAIVCPVSSYRGEFIVKEIG